MSNKQTNPKTKVKVGPGYLVWAVVSGEGAKKFGDDTGREYKATIVVPGEQAQEFVSSLEQLCGELATTKGNVMQHVAWRRYELVKGANGDEHKLHKIEKPSFKLDTTHNYGFAFKQNTTDQNGQQRPIRILNPLGLEGGTEVPEPGQGIGNGSEGVVYGAAVVYSRKPNIFGISLYLDIIQMKKLIPYDLGGHNVGSLEDNANQ